MVLVTLFANQDQLSLLKTFSIKMVDFEELDVHQVNIMLEAGSATLVDIRDTASYQQGHIQGAQNILDHNLSEFLSSANKDVPLICYCYHGISSCNAAQFFLENEFEKVYSMSGGYDEWVQSYPVESN